MFVGPTAKNITSVAIIQFCANATRTSAHLPSVNVRLCDICSAQIKLRKLTNKPNKRAQWNVVARRRRNGRRATGDCRRLTLHTSGLGNCICACIHEIACIHLLGPRTNNKHKRVFSAQTATHNNISSGSYLIWYNISRPRNDTVYQRIKHA